MPLSKMKHHRHITSKTPQFLIIVGVILFAFTMLIFKQSQNFDDEIMASAGELPALQLDRALQAGQPTLAFFHSDNCQQCIVMMDTVAQVYPEFSQKVELVDVNVYDENNAELLRSVGLQYIPILIFFDRSGKGQVSVEMMEDDLLRQTLADLAEGG